ncbi:hypothetical protein GCM10010109_42240 [Actinoplanes campanulatus]|nr:hypothetical protein GCM10010109_42240 [Actinoplanes campanulatus]GID41577.1 hypothetical protein Aca09nite_80830 [Actinoplanes campanulatus]
MESTPGRAPGGPPQAGRRRRQIRQPATAGEVSTAMDNMIDRFRQRRRISRENRAIDRALQSAPTQAMRDELAILAQRRPY